MSVKEIISKYDLKADYWEDRNEVAEKLDRSIRIIEALADLLDWIATEDPMYIMDIIEQIEKLEEL